MTRLFNLNGDINPRVYSRSRRRRRTALRAGLDGDSVGLPQLRWSMMGSLLCATMVAFALIIWRRRAHGRHAA